MAWDYKRDETKADFKPIPEGKHRIRIKSAEEAVSKNSGNNMIALQFEVSAHKGLLFFYIVFQPDKPENTNRSLTRFFDCFKGIPDGNFELDKWVGQVGACMVKHEEYNGKTSAKVAFLLNADEAAGLPAWVEPDNGAGNSSASAGTDFVSVPEGSGDNLPFF